MMNMTIKNKLFNNKNKIRCYEVHKYHISKVRYIGKSVKGCKMLFTAIS